MRLTSQLTAGIIFGDFERSDHLLPIEIEIYKISL